MIQSGEWCWKMLYCLYEVFSTLIGWDLVSFWVSPALSLPVQCPEWVELKPNKGTQVATYRGLELRAWIISTRSRYFRLLTHSRSQIRPGSNKNRGKKMFSFSRNILNYFCQEIPIREACLRSWDSLASFLSNIMVRISIWGCLLRIWNSGRIILLI